MPRGRSCCAALFVWLTVVMLESVSSHAAIVTVPISGTIGLASYDVNINEKPIPGIQVGDTFTGSFTFDDSVRPPQTSPFLPGIYGQTFPAGTGAISATVNFSGLQFTTDSTAETSISMRDNDTDTAGNAIDLLSFFSKPQLPAGWSAPQSGLEIQYNDRGNPPDALDGNVLPTTFDDSLWTNGGFIISLFQQPSGAQVQLPDGASGSISAVNAFIVGTTNITAVPEPSTCGMLLLGGGFVLWRRRTASAVS